MPSPGCETKVGRVVEVAWTVEVVGTVEAVVEVESPLPSQDEATRAIAATTAKRRRDVWVSIVLAILPSTNTDEMLAPTGDKILTTTCHPNTDLTRL